MPLFGNLRIQRGITAYRAPNQQITIPKNQVLSKVRSADMLDDPTPAWLQDSLFSWCGFEYERETLFVKFRYLLNNTESVECEGDR